jgi:conjugal transfer pilus assembly protein TraF
MPLRQRWRHSTRASVSRSSPSAWTAKGLPNFPTFRRDNGIARTLQVTQVPAIYLAEPYTGKITPIGFGVLSESQLIERIATVAAPGADAYAPSITKRVNLQ